MSARKKKQASPTEEKPTEENPTEDKTAGLSEELEDAREKMLRALAEAENLRKRIARETQEAARFGIASLARDMLEVLDNLRRAQATLGAGEVPEALSGFVDGVRMTAQALESALARHGVARMEALGAAFDPNRHEALFEAEGAAGKIIQVVEEGYMIGERLLRPARVGVGKAKGA